jgi:hypothetical protein
VVLKRLSPSLSAAALVVAVLGWTPIGETAQNLVFPPNSVGTAQLKNDAVVSSKVKNGSLLVTDFKKGQLKAGAVGLRGPAGAPGPQGPKGDTGPKGKTGPAGSSTGPAGGVLTGNYPDPGLASAAVGPDNILTGSVTTAKLNSRITGVVLAAGEVAPAGPSPAMYDSFNRVGGTPTVTHLSTGLYHISVEGLQISLHNAMVLGNPIGSTPGIVTTGVITGGNALVIETFTPAGTLTDNVYFSWAVLTIP